MKINFTIRGDTPPGNVEAADGATVTFLRDGREVVLTEAQPFRVYAIIRTEQGDGYQIGVEGDGVIHPAFLPLAQGTLPEVVDVIAAQRERDRTAVLAKVEEVYSA